MDEETLRKMAIEQHLQGRAPRDIYQELARSKPWFFKWLHRHQSGETEWFKDQPKAPHSYFLEIPSELRNLIKNIRIHLEENPYAQVGVSAIKWECQKLGLTPPSDSTINRILRKEGLVKKNSLYPQRSGIPLFPRSPGYQQYPPSRPVGTPIHQKRWTLLFAPHHGPLQPSSLSSPPTPQRRSDRSLGLAPLLENHGHPRFSPSRQRTLFPRQQSISSLLRDCPPALSILGRRSGFHSHRRTLAQWNRGKLQ